MSETDFWLEFIQMYKDSPCLWDQKSADYKNTAMRNIAYGMLIEKIWEINETANFETVRRKIGWFHSKFSKEMEKRKNEKNFKSNWNFFRPLSFLNSQDQGSDNEEFNDDDTNIESDQMDDIKIEPAESNTTQKSDEVVVDEPDLSNEPPEKRLKLTLSNTEDTATDTNKIDFKDDSSTFVEYMTTKMRSFDPTQKYMAQKLIIDVMFLAETNQLKLSSKVVKD